MPALIVEAVDHVIEPGVISAITLELQAGGMESGMFFIGRIKGIPDMIYFLWHLANEVPVSELVRSESLETSESACEAAQCFLMKWNQREG